MSVMHISLHLSCLYKALFNFFHISVASNVKKHTFSFMGSEPATVFGAKSMLGGNKVLCDKDTSVIKKLPIIGTQMWLKTSETLPTAPSFASVTSLSVPVVTRQVTEGHSDSKGEDTRSLLIFMLMTYY